MTWFEEENDDYNDSLECATAKAELKICREWVEALGYHFYQTGSVSGIEQALEELYATLEIELPRGKPVMEKKQ